jgi:hypothetical protein
MANATELLDSIEDQVLEAVRQSQDVVVKAVKSWADAGKNLVPDLPALPFADQLPSATELVDKTFDFADKLIAAQREFASAVIDAAKPLWNNEPVKATNGRGPAKKVSAN